MNNDIIENQYDLVSKYHKKYLDQHGIKLPTLKKSDKYTKDALILIYLSIGYPNTKEISKVELTEFIRKFYPLTSDVQQARHLNTQKGWWIVSGTRRDSNIKNGNYKLISLEKPSPSFDSNRRKIIVGNWEELKKEYQYRCATCGSREGEESFQWPGNIISLQKGHMNPSKPLEIGNIIPQCQICNRVDKNRWEYDTKGRVIKLANAKFVTSFDLNVRKELYNILKKEFDK